MLPHYLKKLKCLNCYILLCRIKTRHFSIDCNGWLEFAGVENDGLENDGLENDGLEQEQTQVLHTLKTFNVYDM